MNPGKGVMNVLCDVLIMFKIISKVKVFLKSVCTCMCVYKSQTAHEHTLSTTCGTSHSEVKEEVPMIGEVRKVEHGSERQGALKS